MTRLLELREAAKLSQVELARMAGVSQSDISRWERGLRPASWSASAHRVAESFGMTFEEFSVRKVSGMASPDAYAAAAAKTRAAADRLLDPMEADTARVEASALKEIAAETADTAGALSAATAHVRLHRAGREARKALKKLDRERERLDTLR